MKKLVFLVAIVLRASARYFAWKMLKGDGGAAAGAATRPIRGAATRRRPTTSSPTWREPPLSSDRQKCVRARGAGPSRPGAPRRFDAALAASDAQVRVGVDALVA